MTVEGSTSRAAAKRSNAHPVAIWFHASSRSDQRCRRYWNPILAAPACAFLLSLVVPTVAIAQQQVARASAASDALPDARNLRQGCNKVKNSRGPRREMP